MAMVKLACKIYVDLTASTQSVFTN